MPPLKPKVLVAYRARNRIQRLAMGIGDTQTLWRETMIQKLRVQGVPEFEVERRADKLMAPILAAQGIVGVPMKRYETDAGQGLA